MNLRIPGLLALTAYAAAYLLGSAQVLAQNAYVPNAGSGTVSVINTATNTVTGTISDPSFVAPLAVAVTPDGSKVYVANEDIIPGGTLSVIDTATNTVPARSPSATFRLAWR